jgi:hypothetical protein
MKEQTAVEWFEDQVGHNSLMGLKEFNEIFEKAKAMERKERLKYQLFIGKVTEILGFDKALELLKECNNEII